MFKPVASSPHLQLRHHCTPWKRQSHPKSSSSYRWIEWTWSAWEIWRLSWCDGRLGRTDEGWCFHDNTVITFCSLLTPVAHLLTPRASLLRNRNIRSSSCSSDLRYFPCEKTSGISQHVPVANCWQKHVTEWIYPPLLNLKTHPKFPFFFCWIP